MKFGKKFTLGFLPTLLVLVAMLVAACGSPAAPQSGQKAPASQQHLHLGFDGGNGSGDITTFDPALDSDAPSSSAIDMIFTGLVQFDNQLNIKGQLAQSWTHSGTTWTFHLKPNLKFSDGSALTANDVAY
ncbi:MAG: ABC transporter substrate-binding protein, partial [Ktedonobacteraceae bacterium]